jgi:hypothetical protein
VTADCPGAVFDSILSQVMELRMKQLDLRFTKDIVARQYVRMFDVNVKQ